MAMIKPTVDAIGDEALTNSIIDRSITEIQDDMVTTLAPYALASCSLLKKAAFGSVTEVANKCFHGDTALETLDFHSAVEFDASALQGLSGLKALILRSNTMCDASSGAVLSYTPIAEGIGYIYVPAALVESYRHDFVWGSYYDQIRAIEDYPEVCEPYSWEAVAKNIENGTYKSAYKIGDSVPVDLGSEGIINMQIAAFDADTLADGTGTAAISWVAKELLNNKQPFDSPNSGTGWEDATLRDYLSETIALTLPPSVFSLIETVSKLSAHLVAGQSGQTRAVYTQDDLWIPSAREVGFTESRESSAATYSELFASNNNRIKRINGTAEFWFLRTATTGGSNRIRSVGNTGSATSSSVTTSYGVCLCFCTGRTPTTT